MSVNKAAMLQLYGTFSELPGFVNKRQHIRSRTIGSGQAGTRLLEKEAAPDRNVSFLTLARHKTSAKRAWQETEGA